MLFSYGRRLSLSSSIYQKNGFKFLGNPEKERYKAYQKDSTRNDTIAMYFFLKTIIA